tara:strand:- start:855 stop:1082 length:228 start_codon:yes stop_codon:yes gene_type:complete
MTTSFYTTTQLAKMLRLEIDALGLKSFADTETPVQGKEILYTGYDIFTHSELQEMYDKEVEAELDRAFAVEASQV